MEESDMEEDECILPYIDNSNEEPQNIVVKVELSSPPSSPLVEDLYTDPSSPLPAPTDGTDENQLHTVNSAVVPEYILGDTAAEPQELFSFPDLVKTENDIQENPPKRARRYVSNRCFARMESILSGNQRLEDDTFSFSMIRVNNVGGVSSKQNAKPYKCSKCYKSYCTERQFWAHPCDPSSLECDICGEKKSNLISLKLHQASGQCGNCKECGKEFIEASALKAHMLLAHAEGASYKCSLCKISFDRVYSLSNHIRKVHSKRSFECDICGKVLQDLKSLECHQEQNTCAKCVECGKVFLDLSSFRAHRLSAHPEGSFLECDICKALFRNVGSLNKHKRKEHVSKTYDCEKCGKKCPDPEKLKAHESEETCDRCYDCGKEYLNTDALKAHRLLAHTEAASHKCPLCEVDFQRSTSLITHIRRVHNETNPYICACCGYKCATPGKLKTHVKTHRDRPYPCDECDMRFTNKSVLLAHKRRLHEKERPYSCSLCNKSFAVGYYLQNHIKNAHNPDRKLKWQARLKSLISDEKIPNGNE